MLVFRILATIFVGISCLTALIKNADFFGGNTSAHDWVVIGITALGWFWRVFVIVALWLI